MPGVLRFFLWLLCLLRSGQTPYLLCISVLFVVCLLCPLHAGWRVVTAKQALLLAVQGAQLLLPRTPPTHMREAQSR